MINRLALCSFFALFVNPTLFCQRLYIAKYTSLTKTNINIETAISEKLKGTQAYELIDKNNQSVKETPRSLDQNSATWLSQETNADFVIFGSYAVREDNIAVNHWVYHAEQEQFSRFLQYGKVNQVQGALSTQFSEKFRAIERNKFITENIPEKEKLILVTNLPTSQYNNIAIDLMRADYQLSSVNAQHQEITVPASSFLLNLHTKQSSLFKNAPHNIWDTLFRNFDNYLSPNQSEYKTNYQELLQQESSFKSLKEKSGANYMVFLLENDDQYYGRAINLGNSSLTWWNNQLELKPDNPFYNGAYLKKEFESYDDSAYGLQSIIGKDKNKPASIAFVTFRNQTGSNDYEWIGPSLIESMHFDMSSQFKYSRVPTDVAEKIASSIQNEKQGDEAMAEMIKQFKQQLDCDFLITGHYNISEDNSIQVYSLLVNLNKEDSMINLETGFPINNTMFNEFAKVSNQMIQNISTYAQAKDDLIKREVFISLSKDEIELFEEDIPALISGSLSKELKRTNDNEE